MPQLIDRIGMLLLITAIVAMLTRRLRIPYSVGLVVTGIAMAALAGYSDIHLTRDLIFTVLLPPLIFEAAFFLRWPDLQRDLVVILTLATLGVVLSAAVTAVGIHYAGHWAWSGAVLFAVLISATDPVAVIAMFKETRTGGRLRTLIEAESLLNDGTAAVLFTVAVAIATGSAVTPVSIASSLLVTIVGGLICGAVVALALLFLAGRTDDHLIEITFTVVAAYGSFLLAEHFHFSGVLATLVTGLMMGTLGPTRAFSAEGRLAVGAFWEFIAFAANSVIFVLIGIQETQQNFSHAGHLMLTAIGLVLLARAAAIYPLCGLFAGSRLRVTVVHQHLLVWGGLRGALALALALSLPEGMAQREQIISVAFGVVTFSIFVQGLTMAPLLRRFT